ncbi:MAG: hypothetical protein FWE45_02585 [Firmicutes bacterium]|nr:hypothetical protein [Bacillota bacterium]
MKKYIVFALSCALCVLVFFGGVSVLGSNASTRESQHVTQPGVNFNFLSRPQMLAICSTNFIYAVEQELSNYRLNIINKSTSQTISRIALPSRPRDIIYARNNLHIFFDTGFYIYATANIRTPGFTFSFASRLQYTTSGDEMSIFSVVPLATPANAVRVLYAHDNRYGYQTVLGSMNQQFGSLITLRQQIRGITATIGGEIYLLASDPENALLFSIQTTSGDVLSQGFYSPSSFNLIEDGGMNFVFIARNRIVLFNLASLVDLEQNSYYEITPRNEDDFLMRESYAPIYLRARSRNEVFVIDAVKRSIDQYRILPNTILEFHQTVAGSIGDDYGFFNHPTAFTMIDEGVFWIADFSSSVRLLDTNTTNLPTPLLHYNQSLSVIRSMAFNNMDTIYAHDRDRRIHRFNTDGSRSGSVITAPTTSEIIELVPNIATGEMFAIDFARNDVFAITNNGLEPLGLGRQISRDTRAVINPWVGEHDTLFLTNTGATGNVHVAICLETNEQTIITTQLNLAGHFLLDLTTDTLGNLIALYENASRNAVFRHIELELVGSSFSFDAGTPMILEGSTTSLGNSSLTFDRMNNQLFWLGHQHVIESVCLQDLTELWSFTTNFTTGAMRPHYNWQVASPILIPTAPLFGTINTLGRPSMFEFPNSIGAQTRLEPGFVFQILQSTTYFNGIPFDYSYILFQNQITRNHYTGYVNNRFITPKSDYYIDSELWGNDGSPNPQNIGRVILNGVPIFKYPTSTVLDLTVGTLNKTRRGEQGLTINRRITVQDIRGWEFFEIRINTDGTPNPNGTHVGYVFVQHVINFNLPPSGEILNPNARVVFSTNQYPNGIPVFSDNGGVNHIVGEYLQNRQRIAVIGQFDRNAPLTRIRYFCSYTQINMYGYVWTRYIVMDGLSALQLMGIILAILGAVGVIIFLVFHFRRKRTQT